MLLHPFIAIFPIWLQCLSFLYLALIWQKLLLLFPFHAPKSKTILTTNDNYAWPNCCHIRPKEIKGFNDLHFDIFVHYSCFFLFFRRLATLEPQKRLLNVRKYLKSRKRRHLKDIQGGPEVPGHLESSSTTKSTHFFNPMIKYYNWQIL